MDKVYDLLKSSKVFFFATVNGDKPVIRPFGAVTRHGGKLYICTNSKKKVYAQIGANHAIAIAAMTPDGGWFRLSATAVLDSSPESIDAMLTENPMLKGMYLGNPDFATLYLKDVVAEISDADNEQTFLKF
ncbi:MAG: pyridoxamine 5'-phosphate oxidase family protein [Bifidobacteriaceae bacterium]|jgi:uncharacterized pyridoxamine 5'-phosphate oxidase family protein|nr:pyridoxamine 5'-phosphate oxidase family protein [Bifidobacteriaceae bacterium]